MVCSGGVMRVVGRQWGDVVTDPRYQVQGDQMINIHLIGILGSNLTKKKIIFMIFQLRFS